MPAGTKLTVINGDVVVQLNGQVISGKDIKGQLLIKASNVTVKNSLIEGHYGEDSLLVQSGTGILLEDDEVTVAKPSVGSDSVRATNTTIRRLNIHGGVDGIKLFSNSTVSATWIHGLSAFAHDPAQDGGPTHNDTIQILGGSNMHVTGNFLQSGLHNNSAIQVTQDSGKISSVFVTGNWASGGNCTFNFSHHNHSGLPTMSGITVTRNRFAHNPLDCPLIHDSKTTIVQSGNVWDTTGTPIFIRVAPADS